MTGPTLVVVDMQQVFGDPASPWLTPRFADAEAVIAGMVPAFERVVFTRFIAPERPEGAWVPYYEQWPFALVPADDPIYDLVLAFRDTGHPVVTETTFGKWGTALREALDGSQDVVLAGVSTDCCVLSTALGAADAGVRIRVAADACAGLSDADHQRALDAMALYAPLIEISDSAAILDGLR
ncbi:isochorismatase family cysteine hydrolase [Leifsonia sp. 1010]|uniref:cysteine hydrolase family protein n=1 Tax=Leifsonia sp. 1010 TaxID=2817769 RepID=UPI002862BFE2|nr:isochorismatase family cysteine hydrolase [Leifsonia sp. 1010]MDR6613953.1 nicotinamidase-related amidase [Leifsonia sp. 1010]